MPKLKKKKSRLGSRRKYHYLKKKHEDTLNSVEDTYKTLHEDIPISEFTNDESTQAMSDNILDNGGFQIKIELNIDQQYANFCDETHLDVADTHAESVDIHYLSAMKEGRLDPHQINHYLKKEPEDMFDSMEDTYKTLHEDVPLSKCTNDGSTLAMSDNILVNGGVLIKSELNTDYQYVTFRDETHSDIVSTHAESVDTHYLSAMKEGRLDPHSINHYLKKEPQDTFDSMEDTYKTLLEDVPLSKCTSDESTQTMSDNILVNADVQTMSELHIDHQYAKVREETYLDIADTCTEAVDIHHLSAMDRECYSASDSGVELGMEEVVVSSMSFQQFAADLKTFISTKQFIMRELERSICLVRFHDSDISAVKLSIDIDDSFICNVSVHRKKLARTHKIWVGLPQVFDTVESVAILVDRAEIFNVCGGNFETEYGKLLPVGSVLTNSFGLAAYREGDFGAKTSSGHEYSSTIRSSNCSLLTKRYIKCKACTVYSYALKKRVNRRTEKENTDRSFNHTTYKHKDMTRDDLYQKLSERRIEIDGLKHEVRKMKRDNEREINMKRVTENDHEH